MDTEKCKIKLNSPQSIYFAGQEIKGQITIVLLKKTKIQGIKFRITGKGKVGWYELLRRESHPITDKVERSIAYSAKETYLIDESYIMGTINSRSVELDCGEHIYDFKYNLNRNLPSSFIGNHGSIKYKIKFFIYKPWTFNDKYSIPINIIKLNNLTLSTLQQTISSNYFHQITKNIGMIMFGGGPITLAAKLPYCFAGRGEKLKLNVTVDNKSNTHIDRCKFSIKQIITYISQIPLCIFKQQITKIFKKETGGIQKKTTRDYEHELNVPFCQPTDTNCSRIIHIKYEVQVDAILPGLYKNLTINLPFTVCAILSNFENNDSDIEWNTSYPNPNSSNPNESITSPSHSSIYADNTSLYSITSDSTISSSSFQRSGNHSDSVSVRSSYRNSEYVLPQNLLRNYPGLPDHVLNSNRISLSSSAPQYSADLPPSYEELYGNSSSQSLPTAPPTSPIRK